MTSPRGFGQRTQVNRTLYVLGSRRFPVLVGLLLGVLSVLGCEPRVSLGVPCASAADCSDPYVCAFGRCRAECSEARDCAFPSECMFVGNVGGCRVDEDDVCTPGSAECGTDLECLDGRCAQPCGESDECAAAQTCATGGECARLPNEGPCNPVGGSCLDGQTCTATGCVSLTAGATGGDLFAACDEPTECRDGLVCATPRCLRACERGASGEALTSCGPGSYCGGSDTSGGPPLSGSAGYCTQPCDPLASGPAAGCPEGFNCGIGIPNLNSYAVCEPMASTGGVRWGACNNQQCAAGLDCVHSIFPESRCLAWCERDADCEDTTEVCDLGPSHRIIDQDGAARTVGICRPVCARVEDCEATLGLEPGSVACTMGRCVRT